MKNKILKFGMAFLCVCFISAAQEGFSAYAYSEENGGEADHYTSDEDWTPAGLELDVIKESKLDDEHSIVYLIMPDGFLDTDEDKEKFGKEAEKLMDYVLHINPYSEFSDITKVYTLYTPSAESGAGRDMSYSEYKNILENGGDKMEKDTFFRSSFNQLSNLGNYERLLEPTMAGVQRCDDIAKAYGIDYDQIVIICNSNRYGGSGLSETFPSYKATSSNASEPIVLNPINLAVTSVHASAKEIVAHEIGHALGNLADEYWPGEVFAFELANMTKNHNPETIKWKKFLDYKENTRISIHSYTAVGYGDPAADRWYKPTEGICKMQLLSTRTVDHEFCEVCREGLRDSMSKYAQASTIHWQDYGKNSRPTNAQKNEADYSGYKTSYQYTGKPPKEIEESFVVRHKGQIVENPKIRFTYYNEKGKELGRAPFMPGKYKVRAEFVPTISGMNEASMIRAYTIEGEANLSRDSSGDSSSSSSGSSYTNAKAGALGWKRDEKGWKYGKSGGGFYTKEWLGLGASENMRWYYFGEDAYMMKGWLNIDGSWYYLSPLQDASEGMMLTGWQLINGKWYYLNPISDGSKGRMFSNRRTPDGYFVRENGEWDGAFAK